MGAALDQIGHCRFLFGEPTFVNQLDPERSEKKAFTLSEQGLQLSNQLLQKKIAKQCADWIANKVDIRTIRQTNLLHGKLYHIANGLVEQAIVGSSNFTVRGNAQQGPFVNVAKSDLEVAQDYLSNDQLAECGNRLRKCVEEVLEQFLIIARDKTLHGDLISRGEFASLESKINEAKGLLCQQALNDFAAVLQSDFTADEFAAILSEEGIDPTKIVATDSKKKGKIIARLMAARKQLQDTTLHLLTDQARKQLNAAKLLDEIKKIKNRILNPASHAGVTPLYTKEAEDAIKVVDQLRVTLDAVLPTL
jgi:hypothetical protein